MLWKSEKLGAGSVMSRMSYIASQDLSSLNCTLRELSYLLRSLLPPKRISTSGSLLAPAFPLILIILSNYTGSHAQLRAMYHPGSPCYPGTLLQKAPQHPQPSGLDALKRSQRSTAKQTGPPPAAHEAGSVSLPGGHPAFLSGSVTWLDLPWRALGSDHLTSIQFFL